MQTNLTYTSETGETVTATYATMDEALSQARAFLKAGRPVQLQLAD